MKVGDKVYGFNIDEFGNIFYYYGNITAEDYDSFSLIFKGDFTWCFKTDCFKSEEELISAITIILEQRKNDDINELYRFLRTISK